MLSEIHDTRTQALSIAGIDSGIVDLKRLQMFHISVKAGSFAAAAQQLSVSPSAISHAMKVLEEDLGCALFRRFGPQVKPTGAAVRLIPMVEDILLLMQGIKSELAALDGRREGLIFCLPGSLAAILQPDFLSTFHECFPNAEVEIELKNEGSADTSNKLVDFEIDYLQRLQENRVRRDLIREELGAYLAPFHQLGQKSKLTISELKQSLLVFPDRLASELFLEKLGRGNADGLKTWILPNPVAARDLAQQGKAIVFLPQWAIASKVHDGALMKIKLPGLELHRTCCASWSPDRPLTWVAEVFLSLLATDLESRT